MCVCDVCGMFVVLIFLYQKKHYCKLLYYFIDVVCLPCLLKGIWYLFVFER